MVSVLPSARSPFDLIGEMTGNALNQSLPQAVQQGYQRQLGLNALDQAQNEIQNAGNDPFKMALAFAKAVATNPALERSAGTLFDTALRQATLNRAFPGQEGQQENKPQMLPQLASNAALMGQNIQPQNVQHPIAQSPNVRSGASNFIMPSPFNIFSPDQMQQEATRYAQALRDPQAYDQRYNQLQKANEQALGQREYLESFALKSGVSPEDLPMFMRIASKFNPNNPTEWAIQSKREWDKEKNNFDKLDRAFIPGLGSGLLGRNRKETLDNMKGTVNDLVKAGFEQEVRKKLADNYLTPTEIGELIYPITDKQKKGIKSINKGIFPFNAGQTILEKGFPETKQSPFISYEEALERAPQEMQTMQNTLSNFFKENTNEQTSLLALRDKLIKEKDYDWRQFGPAIRQAIEEGLTLTPQQNAELTDIDTQPPYDSLGDIFKDMDRVVKFMRGNR